MTTPDCTHDYKYWGYASSFTHYGPETVSLYECTQCGQISSYTLSNDLTLTHISEDREGTHEKANQANQGVKT